MIFFFQYYLDFCITYKTWRPRMKGKFVFLWKLALIRNCLVRPMVQLKKFCRRGTFYLTDRFTSFSNNFVTPYIQVKLTWHPLYSHIYVSSSCILNAVKQHTSLKKIYGNAELYYTSRTHATEWLLSWSSSVDVQISTLVCFKWLYLVKSVVLDVYSGFCFS